MLDVRIAAAAAGLSVWQLSVYPPADSERAIASCVLTPWGGAGLLSGAGQSRGKRSASSSALQPGVGPSGDDPVAGHSNRSPHGSSVISSLLSPSGENRIVSGVSYTNPEPWTATRRLAGSRTSAPSSWPRRRTSACSATWAGNAP